MTDSTRNNSEAIALSPALVESQGNLSKSGGKNLFKDNKILGAASLLVTSLIDGSNPASIDTAKQKGQNLPGQSNGNLSGSEDRNYSGLSSPSAFAVRVDQGLRDLEHAPIGSDKASRLNNIKTFQQLLGPERQPTQPPHSVRPAPEKEQAVSAGPAAPAITATSERQVSKSDIAQHTPQLNYSRSISFTPTPIPKPISKPKPSDSSNGSDKAKQSDLAKWTESHPEMTPYESKFSWLVNDFRQNPKKYESWYNAPHKRTRPLPPLDFSSRQSKLAEINTDAMASRGLGHWGPGGFEIAGVGGGSEERVLKMFLNSPGHRKNIEEHVSKFGVSKKGGRITMRFA